MKRRGETVYAFRNCINYDKVINDIEKITVKINIKKIFGDWSDIPSDGDLLPQEGGFQFSILNMNVATTGLSRRTILILTFISLLIIGILAYYFLVYKKSIKNL